VGFGVNGFEDAGLGGHGDVTSLGNRSAYMSSSFVWLWADGLPICGRLPFHRVGADIGVLRDEFVSTEGREWVP
jgi:hypothetical protein